VLNWTTGIDVYIVEMIRTAVYGTVRTMVWEDGGSNPASYPLRLPNRYLVRYTFIHENRP